MHCIFKTLLYDNFQAHDGFKGENKVGNDQLYLDV